MRFIVVLVIFSVIACTSCNVIKEPVDLFDELDFDEAEFESVIAYGPVIKCSECYKKCKETRKDPFISVCYNKKKCYCYGRRKPEASD